MSPRVLITGGSGFIGTNLIEFLRNDFDVFSIDSAPPRNDDHRAFWQDCDLLNSDRLSRIVESVSPDYVLHFGARTDLGGTTLDDYAANTDGVRNLIRALAGLNQEPRTIYASSRLVFAIDHDPAHEFDYLPSTVYGESKIVGERIVLESASAVGPWAIVRPTSIWGPWFGTPYRDFFDLIAHGRYLRAGRTNPVKSFGYVGNAVYEVRKLMDAPLAEIDRRVFWLTDYPPLRVNDWAELISRELGKPAPRRVPIPFLRAAAKLGDGMKRLGLMDSPPLTTFRLNNLLTDMTYNTSELEDLVGPLPISLEEAVRETVDWVNRSTESTRAERK